MNPVIRAAAEQDYAEIRALYHAIIDALDGNPLSAGWQKDIYPDPDMLHRAIGAGEMFAAVEDGRIAAAMIVNHAYNPAYDEFAWPQDFAPQEITVIHALGVHPQYMRRGIAKAMVRHVLDTARTQGQRAVRLDVLRGNLPAERLYPALGFEYRGTLPMYYVDTGRTDYELYEYILNRSDTE